MENWNTLSKRVATRIEDMIGSRADARLPSQRELSSLFGVSRTSVREALSLLEASGKLRTEPGRGSFWVGAQERTLQHTDLNTLRNTEVIQDLPSKKTYPKSEISRFRYLIEGQSGRLAAMRITDSEVAQLERNLSTFKKSDASHGPRGQRTDRFRVPPADRRVFRRSTVSRSSLVFPRSHYAGRTNVPLAIYARMGARRRARENRRGPEEARSGRSVVLFTLTYYSERRSPWYR